MFAVSDDSYQDGFFSKEDSAIQRIWKTYKADIVGTCLGVGLAAGAAALGFNVSKVVDSKELAEQLQFHKFLHSLARHITLKPLRQLGVSMESLDVISTVVLAPVLEEFEFRYLFQEVLLRRLPRLLTEIFTDDSSWVDSEGMREFRVKVITSLFSLAHYDISQRHGTEDFVTRFAGNRLISLIYSSNILTKTQERTRNVNYGVAVHALHNLSAVALQKGLTRLLTYTLSPSKYDFWL